MDSSIPEAKRKTGKKHHHHHPASTNTLTHRGGGVDEGSGRWGAAHLLHLYRLSKLRWYADMLLKMALPAGLPAPSALSTLPRSLDDGGEDVVVALWRS